MRKLFSILCVFMILCCVFGCTKKRNINEPIAIPYDVYVVDSAGVLPDDDRTYLDGLCKMFYDKTGKTIKVLTMKYVLDKKFGEKPLTSDEADRFVEQTFYKSWEKIGKDGALVFIATKDKVAGIHTEGKFKIWLPGGKKDNIVEDVAIRYFSENKYSEGIVGTLEKIFEIVDPSIKLPAKEEYLATHKTERKLFYEDMILDYLFVFIIFVVAGIFLPFKVVTVLSVICIGCFISFFFFNGFMLYPFIGGACLAGLLGLLPSVFRFYLKREKNR